MKFITGGRGSGRTSKLIEMASEQNATIVAENRTQLRYIHKQATRMGIEIKEPIELWTFLRYNFNERKAKGPFLIDNLDDILNLLQVNAAVISDKTEVTGVVTNPTLWQEKEVERAIEEAKEKCCDPDSVIQIYQTALSAFKGAAITGHAYENTRNLKNAFGRLVDRLPLVAIEIYSDHWENSQKLEDGTVIAHAKGYGSLHKIIDPNRKISFHDDRRVKCVNVLSETQIPYLSYFIRDIIDEMYPIRFPYYPIDKPLIVLVESFACDPDNETDDTLAILCVTRPDGKTQDPINRYFKQDASTNNEIVEICQSEYDYRKELWNKRKEETNE